MSNRKILVTGPNLDPSAVKLAQDHGFETIHTPAYADSAVIAEMLIKSGAEGIVSRMGRIDASVMDAAPQLRVISKHGVGVDNIDLDAATARGITVLMATGANAVSVAEHAIALMLASVKRVVPLDAGLHEGRWEKPGFLGRELAGSRLGLLGMGAIAQATGRIAKGLGLELYGYDPFVKPAAFEDLGVTRCDSLPEFFARCDVLSLHCPLTTETRGIVNAEAIAQMPKGAFIINTARGGLIDEAALVAAIRSGHLGGAGLDTFAVEPPAPDHPFFAEASIVLTPHIGGVTREASARVGVDAVRGILQVLAGEAVDLERIANRAVLAKAAQPHVKAGE